MRARSRSTKPKSPPDAQALYEIAVRALARRARSAGEMRQLLERRRGDTRDVDAVMARLKEHGYLDDARFARAFVASRLENDKQGARRVERDLAARRVPPELIRKAVREAYEPVEEGALLREYLRRKVRLTQPPEKPSAVASLYRRLLRAGFSSATIVKELQGLMERLPRRAASRGAAAAIAPEKWQEWLESLADFPEEEDSPEPRA